MPQEPEIKPNIEVATKEKLESELKKKSFFKRIFFSDSFLEKFSFLLLTALITGLLIPIISQNVQKNNSKNDAILNNQVKLLDDVSNIIMTYETLVLDVSFYKSHNDVNNSDLQTKAYEKYSQRVTDLFSQWRFQISKARYLTSPTISSKLEQFLDTVLNKQDLNVTMLYLNKSSTVAEWRKQHDLSHEIYHRAVSLISELANDLKITKSDLKN